MFPIIVFLVQSIQIMLDIVDIELTLFRHHRSYKILLCYCRDSFRQMVIFFISFLIAVVFMNTLGYLSP